MLGNYRIVRLRGDVDMLIDDFYAIHTVCYDTKIKGKVIKVSEKPAIVIGCTEEEIRQCFRAMEKAFLRPVIDYKPAVIEDNLEQPIKKVTQKSTLKYKVNEI